MSYCFQSDSFFSSQSFDSLKEPFRLGFEADSLFGAVFGCLGNKAGEKFSECGVTTYVLDVSIVSAMLCVHLPRGFGVLERAIYFGCRSRRVADPRLNNAVLLLPMRERYCGPPPRLPATPKPCCAPTQAIVVSEYWRDKRVGQTIGQCLLEDRCTCVWIETWVRFLFATSATVPADVVIQRRRRRRRSVQVPVRSMAAANSGWWDSGSSLKVGAYWTQVRGGLKEPISE